MKRDELIAAPGVTTTLYGRLAIYANATLKAGIPGVNRLLEYLREKDTTDGCDDTLMITSEKRHEILDKEYFKNLIARYQG